MPITSSLLGGSDAPTEDRMARPRASPPGWLLTLLAMSSCSGPAPEQAAEESETVTVYEGARLIVGDRAGHRERHVRRRQRPVPGGRRGRREWTCPRARTRVDLTGMTVIPAIVDAHTHLGATREALIEDLERRAYHGVGAAMSLGHG